MPPLKYKTAADFWAAVKKVNNCWEWQGRRDKWGYGFKITLNGIWDKPHRHAFLLHNGYLTKGLSVCHACDNPPCINPAHLFQGTQADNMRDMGQKERARSTKLTGQQVKQIRKLRKQSVALTIIAEKYNMSLRPIADICNGKTWKHITNGEKIKTRAKRRNKAEMEQ